MEVTRALHLLQLALDDGDAVGDQAAIHFELAFAGAAEKAEAAALALEMGPRAHQPRALIGKRRQLDLQSPFVSLRARPKDLEDEAGAVDDLGLPAPLEVALLHGAERGIDDNHFRFERARFRGDFFDLAPADQARRTHLGQRHDVLGENGKPDRGGQPRRFCKPRLGVAIGAPAAPCARLLCAASWTAFAAPSSLASTDSTIRRASRFGWMPSSALSSSCRLSRTTRRGLSVCWSAPSP